MRTPGSRPWLSAGAPFALAAALLVAGHAQVRDGLPRERDAARTPVAAPAGRVVAQRVAPPAIDRGLATDGAVTGPHHQGGVRTARTRELPWAPGKVIVKFRDGRGNQAERTALMRAAGASRLARPSYADFEILAVDPSADPEAIASSLRPRPEVEYAQAAYRVRAYHRPNDPLYAQQWNFPLINIEQAWDINRGASSEIVVAVLDTGVAYQNAIFQFTAGPFEDAGSSYPALGLVSVPFAAAPELGPSTRFVSPRDFIWDDEDPVDLDGHGTHVSGTIASLTDNSDGVAGVAFNVRIMPVKCITGPWDDIFGSPFVGTDDVVARAIRYAADNGAQVINMSIGRTEGGEAPVIGAAMRYAVSRGAFIAVAAGNEYEEGNPIERIAEQAGPIDGAMVVAAVGPDRNRASYSGVASYVEIAAPGGNSRLSNGLVLQQTYDPDFSETFLEPPSQYGPPRFDVFQYRGAQGTSMATPHVSGVAALVVSQGITKPEAVEAALKRFAADRGTTGRDDEYGYGLVDARATLRGFGILR